MIKIDLKDSQKQQIERNLEAFITKKNILNKIRKIACYLEDQNCGNTAELLRKIDLNFFLTFGKQSLQNYIAKFEHVISIDNSQNGGDNIKSIIANGPEGKRLPGFLYLYKKFSDSDEAYDILKIINATVCPYCNRQYTFTIRKGNLKSRPQFDHYFPKSQFPYLSISVYNLIPSCALCNNGKRNSSPDRILYPYEESFETKEIRFQADNIVPYILREDNDISISLVALETPNENKSDIISAYNEDFKIEALYKLHSEEARKIIEKKYIFNDEALESICRSYSDAVYDKKYLKELIFGKYEVEDFINHPLSKFTSDIFEQISELDLHKK